MFSPSSFTVDDPCVSNKHLRIYTVVFDADAPADGNRIGPLVYAEDLSSNGSLWNGLHMGYRRGTVLLTNGDVLILGERTRLTYHGRYEKNERSLSSLVVREMKVRAFVMKQAS